MNTNDEDAQARFRKEQMLIDQSWISEWKTGQFALSDEQKERIKMSSEAIKKLMFAFPPLCLVKPKRPLQIPQMGTIGFVLSYSDDDASGTLVVKQSPGAEFSGGCNPGDLEVVGYYKGLTPQIVSTMF